MILTCPNCATRYQADPATIPQAGRNVRCAKCGQVWFQAPPEPEPENAPEPAPMPAHEAHDHAPEPAMSRIVHPMASAAEDTLDDAPPMGFGIPARDREAEAPRRSGFGRVVGWLVLIALVAAAIYAALQYREIVASYWPKTASLYAALGMNVNVLGLDFRDVHPGQTLDAGQPLLVLTGRVVNIADHTIPVPQVRVALIDGQDREVYHWTFETGAGTLAPGAAGAFTTRLSAPPQEARTISVRFVEPGEQ